MWVRLLTALLKIDYRGLTRKTLKFLALYAVVVLPLLYLNVALVKRGFSPEQMSKMLSGERSEDVAQYYDTDDLEEE